MFGLPSRSAIVRATRRTLSCARAESPSSLTLDFNRFVHRFVKRAELANLPRCHLGVASRTSEVSEKRSAWRCRAATTCSRISSLLVPGVPLGQLLERDGRDLDVDVDAVQQRPADFRHVPLDLRDVQWQSRRGSLR